MKHTAADGLITAILSVPVKVNQRLPSGPTVMPSALSLPEESMGNSCIACVVGLIMPIWFCARLGEPHIAVRAFNNPVRFGTAA